MEIKNNEIVTHRSNDCVFKLELSDSIQGHTKTQNHKKQQKFK